MHSAITRSRSLCIELFLLSQEENLDPESVSYFRLMMDARERWQDRARFLGRLAVTPTVGEWSAIGLPEPLLPLYRAVRFFRLARRCWPLRSVRGLCNDRFESRG